MEVKIEFKSSLSGKTLRGRFVKAGVSTSKSPLVFMLTGDGRKGSKSLSWVNIPPKLAEYGISSFLFDFEGLGYSDGNREELTVSTGIRNLEDAFKIIKQQDWIDTSKIGCFAASYGATTLLLSPKISNSIAVIGLKSPAAFIPDAYFNEVGIEEFQNWKEKGYSEINGYKFDVFIDSLKHNTFITANDINTPCYITQGDKDEIVPFQQTHFLFESLQSTKKELKIFKNGNHGYSKNNDWETMASYFVTIFKNHLL